MIYTRIKKTANYPYLSGLSLHFLAAAQISLPTYLLTDQMLITSLKCDNTYQCKDAYKFLYF